MSNIIGMFCIGPNPAACLVQDGKLIAMAEEERFRRNKDIELYVPFQAMHYCLNEGGIEIKDINTIAYAWDCNIYKNKIFLSNFKRFLKYNDFSCIQNVPFDESFSRLLYSCFEIGFHHPSVIKKAFRTYWNTIDNNLPIPEIKFVSHHLAHAVATYYTSGFDEATILTMDRNGEETCSAIWKGQGTNIRLIEKYQLPHSLGWFYAGFTDYLGFRPEYHEGKVMGLSAYGHPNEKIAKKINKILKSHPNGSYSLDPSYFFYGPGCGYAYSNKMVDTFGQPLRKKNKNDIDSVYKDIAYAVQNRLEQVVINLTARAIRLTRTHDICLVGGISLNCLANGKLSQCDFIHKIFVPPHVNDAGTAVGAALWVAHEQGYDPRFTLTHSYWGPGYSDEKIFYELNRLRIPYQPCDEIEKIVAQDIANGQTAGWFQGRMEMGPRALGARSILCDARNPKMHYHINKIKGREIWRPLAPAILEESMNEYFNSKSSPFMTFAFSVNPKKRIDIPAVVHIDGTTRPQTVSINNGNPRFYNLLKEFQKITGIPVILNTSFNIESEPIVCNISDAIKTFYASELDVLAIGSALVYKK